MTAIALGSVLGGMALGFLFLDPSSLETLDVLVTAALWVLLFGIGLDLGRTSGLLVRIRGLGWAILTVPVAIALGSIIGTSLVAGWLGLAVREGAAVGAGFGWYSLSAVIISQNHDVALGAVAFLANVFRELLAIICIPLVAAKIGHLAAVAPGGATTMDVTLPLVAKSTSKDVTMAAFISGVILSGLVPILVPLLLP